MLETEDNTNKSKSMVNKPEISVPDRYDSPFMKLIVPFIATRYLWLAIEDLNPFDFLKKKESLVKKGVVLGVPWSESQALTTFQKIGRYSSRNFAAFGMGLTFLSAMAFYSKNTLRDIKSLYSEAVGYELDKKPEDVTLGDIFSKSQNAALEVTREAYVKRTLARIATTATFFIPWQIFRGFKEQQPKYDANANAGVGAVGTYVLGEGFFREKSFFDAEQELVGTAIHHSDANPNQSISSMNIKSLLFLQRRHLNKQYAWPPATSQEGHEQLALAERIASLMNQTYENDQRTEHAHFTIGKFNFLIGFGLLDKYPESLSFVELANRSKDMSEVKEVAAAIRAGEDPQQTFAKFGLDINKINVKNPLVDAPDVNTSEKFTQKIQPKTHQDFAAHPDNTQHLAV